MPSISVAKDSPVPLHVQLLNQLRQLILGGTWQPHERLPSEPELAEQLGISRNTIRQALDAAEREGLIYRVAGKGTFVEVRPDDTPYRLAGFVIPQFHSTFDSNLLLGVEQVLKSRRYQALFCHSERLLEEENRCLAALVRNRVDGMVIWPVQSDDLNRELFRLSMRGFPLVLLDRAFPYLEADCVLADNFGGAYAATRHLIELGHRLIAFLARPYLHLLPVAERLAAYRQAMRDAGIEPLPPLLVGEAVEPSTAATMHVFRHGTGPDIDDIGAILTRPDRPTAIVAMNDHLALMSLRTATLAGLSVPADLSIVGFDNLDIVQQLGVALTTVVQQPFELGAAAAHLLLDRLDGYRGAPRTHRLPTTLLVRATSGPPPAEQVDLQRARSG